MTEPKSSRERKQMMLEMRSRGDSLSLIASRFGISRQRVSTILRPKDTKTPNDEPRKAADRKPRERLTPSRIKEVINLYQSGLSAPVVAERCNVSVSTVYRAVSGRSWSDITGIEPIPFRRYEEQISQRLKVLTSENEISRN